VRRGGRREDGQSGACWPKCGRERETACLRTTQVRVLGFQGCHKAIAASVGVRPERSATLPVFPDVPRSTNCSGVEESENAHELWKEPQRGPLTTVSGPLWWFNVPERGQFETFEPASPTTSYCSSTTRFERQSTRRVVI
jgi:hypothetical protein